MGGEGPWVPERDAGDGVKIETVTVTEIIEAARTRQASLVAESSGHLILAAGEATGGRPLEIVPDGVVLSTEGTVRIVGEPVTASEQAAVAARRKLLGSLLAVSHGPAPALRALAARRRGTGADEQENWTADLSSALIPINRGAAKRALARLARETIRARPRCLPSKAPSLPAANLHGPAEAALRTPGAPLRAEARAADAPPTSHDANATPEWSEEIWVELSEPAPAADEATPTATEVDVLVVEASEAVRPIEELVTTPPDPTPVPDAASPEARAVEDDELPAEPEGVAQPTPAPPERSTVPGSGAPPAGMVPTDETADDRDRSASEPPLPLTPDPSPHHGRGHTDEAAAPLASVGHAEGDPLRTDQSQPFMPSPSAPVAELWHAVTDAVTDPSPSMTPTPDDADRTTFIGIGEPSVARPDRAPADDPTVTVETEVEPTPAGSTKVETPPAAPEEQALCSDAAPTRSGDDLAVTALPIESVGDGDDAVGPVEAEEPSGGGQPAELLSFESDRATLPHGTLPPTPNGADESAGRSSPPSNEAAGAVELPDELLAEFSEALELPVVGRTAASPATGLPFASSAAPLSPPAPAVEPPSSTEAPPSAPAPPSAAPDDRDDGERGTAAHPPFATSNDDHDDEVDLDLEPSCSVADVRTATAAGDAETPSAAQTPPPDDATARLGETAPPAPASAAPMRAAPVRSVESLLDRFGDDGSPGGARTLRDAARSLQRFAQIATPTPAPARSDLVASQQPDTPSPTSGLTVSTAPPKAPAIPPETFIPKPLRAPRATTRWSAALLLVGLMAIGAIWWRYPAFFVGSESPIAGGPAHPAKATPGSATTAATAPLGSCWSELQLTDLPSPHEVLLGLGKAPVTAAGLPSGTRLELVTTAAGHQPRRTVVPAERRWLASPSGPLLDLAIELEPTSDPVWPDAPAGTTGGEGPAGTLQVSATPAQAEVWLVLAAGTGPRVVTAIPCDGPVELLVVNPADFGDQRRLSMDAAER